jgi:hypothetical protein
MIVIVWDADAGSDTASNASVPSIFTFFELLTFAPSFHMDIIELCRIAVADTVAQQLRFWHDASCRFSSPGSMPSWNAIPALGGTAGPG